MCIIQRSVVVIDEKEKKTKPVGQYYKSDMNFSLCFLASFLPPFPSLSSL